MTTTTTTGAGAAPRNRTLQRALEALVERSGGAVLTRQARQTTVRTFCATLAEQGIRPNSPAEISHRRIRDYVAQMKAAGVAVRTMHNRAAHLRALVPHAFAFRDQTGQTRPLTNEVLGLAGASRAGTKRAITADELQERLARVQHPGVRAALLLERQLGLRGMEALRSGRWLATWERQLAAGATCIRVSEGTKGGRARDVHLYEPATALWAVRQALAIVDRHDRLVDAPPRRKPLREGQRDKPLMRAAALYRRLVRAGGFVGISAPHALRYAWACDRMDAYAAEGYTRQQARLMTSLDLGHGDGRGRYVERTYGRR